MTDKPHITTRRGFIAAVGFGGVSLYGLWAAYGAAPTPLAMFGLGQHDGHADADAGHGGGNGGHGAAAHGPTAEEFNRLTAEFIERYRLADGTVHPRRAASLRPAHAGDHGAVKQVDMGQGAVDHARHAPDARAHDAAPAPGDDAIDVYLAAGMWYYLPGKLRLDAGERYRLRMMALDVAHGASMQFGRGGRMVRLRPRRMSELDISFHEPGSYLVYCTMYCGPGHDVMQAVIDVV
jgi:hypothetical protein